MSKDSASKALGVVIAVLAAVLVVGALTFAGPCVHDDGSASACQASQFGIVGAGAVALIAAIASLLVKNRAATSALLFVAAAAGLFAAFAPGNLLALCMMSSMRCRAVMQPFAQFAGVALAAVSIIAGIRAARKSS